MVYRQIEAGPFYGLFTVRLSLDEQLTVNEVVEKLDAAESLFRLTPGKRFLAIEAVERVNQNIIDEDVESIVRLAKARGYFVIGMLDGRSYPGYAKELNHVCAVIKLGEKWLGYPVQSLIVIDDGAEKMPELKPYNSAVNKVIVADRGEFKRIFKLLQESDYSWAVVTPQGANLFSQGVSI